MTDPYAVLGIPPGASKEESKAAYRRLAMEHHPDRGGSEAKFKAVKAAFEFIQSVKAKKPVPKQTARSSPPPHAPTKTEPGKIKPAKGYEARGPVKLAKSTLVKGAGETVTLELTEKQAFEGCVVPFISGADILEWECRPGTFSFNRDEIFKTDRMVGVFNGTRKVRVILKIISTGNKPPPKPEPFFDSPLVHHIQLQVCALGLFTGGVMHAQDHLQVAVPVTVPPGFDQKFPIIVPGAGYGLPGNRGDMHINIVPVFKLPRALNQLELKMLTRLQEMTNEPS